MPIESWSGITKGKFSNIRKRLMALHRQQLRTRSKNLCWLEVRTGTAAETFPVRGLKWPRPSLTRQPMPLKPWRAIIRLFQVQGQVTSVLQKFDPGQARAKPHTERFPELSPPQRTAQPLGGVTQKSDARHAGQPATLKQYQV